MVFGRIARLFRAEINSTIDNWEDIEKSLRLAGEDARKQLEEAKASMVEVVTAEKLLGQEATRLKNDAKRWETDAETALLGGREDLAKVALGKALIAKEQLKGVNINLQNHREAISKLRSEYQTAQEKVRLAQSKQSTLIARHRSAQAHKALSSVRSKESDPLNLGDISREFDRIEAKVEQNEADAQASLEVSNWDNDDIIHNELQRVGNKVEIETALLRLKGKMVNQAQEQKQKPDNLAVRTTETLSPAAA